MISKINKKTIVLYLLLISSFIGIIAIIIINILNKINYINIIAIFLCTSIIISFFILNYFIKKLNNKNEELVTLTLSQKLLSSYSLSLIEASRDPMFAINPQGIITDLNQATVLATGVEREKLIGTEFIKYFTEPHQARNGYRKIFSYGFINDYPLTIIDGKLTDVLFNGSVYKDESEKIIGAVLVARDITEQKRIAKQLEKSLKEVSDYKYALDESSIVDFTDDKGIIKYVNENFCKISQYTNLELIGNTHKLINSNFHTKEFIEDLWITLLNGEIWRGEIKNKSKDGSFYWVLTTIVPFLDEKNKPYQFVAIRTDITVQKNSEAELNDAKNRAEKATIKAEDATMAKQQFLSNMSHEIRTPMNAIIGFTKIILKTELSTKQREYVNAIKISGDTLIILVNDILDLAKVDSGKMTFEKIPFKMASSVSAMLQLFESKIQEKNLSLEIEYDKNIPDVLIGDPTRLHQIILNLVGNAVKFTNNGKISINVKLIEEHKEKVIIEFTISDTGIGIREDKIESIFENFQQASNGTSRIFGGTGLGLAIVKHLLEPQGGTIFVSSKINEGSTFCFTLPFSKTTDEVFIDSSIVEIDSEIKNIRILVVEDIAINQLLMKTLLDDFGFEMDVANNGKIAIEKLKDKTYDIVLMDLQMPEMNGFEATEYIRKQLKLTMPIIALTADVTTVDVEKCKLFGMDDYIAKPVDEKILYNKLIQYIKKKDYRKNDIKTNPTLEKKSQCTNLNYLTVRTKSNPLLMMEMITLYLEQTPQLINSMKNSLHQKDWEMLHASIHKIIPSFAIVGIDKNFEIIAKKIQDYTIMQEKTHQIPDLVSQIEEVCLQACDELEKELQKIKRTQS